MNNLIIEELNILLSESDKLWIKRKRKINTSFLFKFMAQLLVKNKGIKHLLAYDKLDTQSYLVSDAAICKSRQRCNYRIFESIKNKLVNKFTNNVNIYAIYGSKIRLQPSFEDQDFTKRNNSTKHILGMISTIFNVTNKLPFNTLLCKHYNERTAVCQQLKHIPQNSILIFDRGYYSKNMVTQLEKHNMKYLFRLKKDANKNVKEFFNNKKKKLVLLH